MHFVTKVNLNFRVCVKFRDFTPKFKNAKKSPNFFMYVNVKNQLTLLQEKKPEYNPFFKEFLLLIHLFYFWILLTSWELEANYTKRKERDIYRSFHDIHFVKVRKVMFLCPAALHTVANILIFPCTFSQSPWFFLWAGYYFSKSP
jgi:hypothetical protein